MRFGVRTVTSVGLLSAASVVVMMAVKFPIVPGAAFLKYDPSDAVGLLAGFWFGPLPGVVTVFLKDLLLWLIRDGNPLGPLADAIAAGTFVGVCAAVLHRHAPGQPARPGWAPGAMLAGILLGTVARVAVMSVLNFPILYLQFGTPPQKVAAMLLPAIVPFNALKSLINGLFAMVLALALVRRGAVVVASR